MSIFQAFLRVLRLNPKERFLPVFFTLSALFIATAQIFEPILFGRVIDALTRDRDFFGIVGTWVALGGVNVGTSILLSIISDRYAHRQRIYALEAAFAKTIELPYAQHSLHPNHPKWRRSRL
jgi:ATP-binding cassette, subfamily B, beta-glucan exporter